MEAQGKGAVLGTKAVEAQCKEALSYGDQDEDPRSRSDLDALGAHNPR